MFPLISKGYKQQLQARDVYELMQQDTAEVGGFFVNVCTYFPATLAFSRCLVASAS